VAASCCQSWGLRARHSYRGQGVWRRESPAGSRGRAPVGDLGDEVPQKPKHFVYKILSEAYTGENFMNSTPTIVTALSQL